jgi:hypothetical protein
MVQQYSRYNCSCHSLGITYDSRCPASDVISSSHPSIGMSPAVEIWGVCSCIVHATESKSLFHDVDTMKSGCRGYRLKVPKSVPHLLSALIPASEGLFYSPGELISRKRTEQCRNVIARVMMKDLPSQRRLGSLNGLGVHTLDEF